MNKELMEALDILEKEKDIPKLQKLISVTLMKKRNTPLSLRSFSARL